MFLIAEPSFQSPLHSCKSERDLQASHSDLVGKEDLGKDSGVIPDIVCVNQAPVSGQMHPPDIVYHHKCVNQAPVSGQTGPSQDSFPPAIPQKSRPVLWEDFHLGGQGLHTKGYP